MSKRKNSRVRQSTCRKPTVILEKLKENWTGYIASGIVGFLILGVLNALFNDTFAACSVAIKGSSAGFLRKWIDVYYICAAKASNIDFMQNVVGWWCVLVLMSPFVILDFVKMKIWRELDSAINEYDDYEREADNILKLKGSEQENLSIKEQHEKLKEDIKLGRQKVEESKLWVRRKIFVAKLITWGGVILLCFVYSFDLIACSLLRGYHNKVREIRPVISDVERFGLDRRWVKMKSRNDYREIMALIDGYSERTNSVSREVLKR